MTSSSPFPSNLFPPAVPPAVAPAVAGALGGTQPSSLASIVQLAERSGFSDVHLGVGEEPRYRARGEMLRTGWPISDAATFHGWLREMLSPAQIDAFQRDKEFDGSHAFPFVRVRINLLDSLRGPAMVLRLIPQQIASLGGAQPAACAAGAGISPEGTGADHGPHGLGQEHHPRRDDRLDQSQPQLPHPHD